MSDRFYRPNTYVLKQRDEKTCLSSEIEVPQVEEVVKTHDFPLNPLCKLHREIIGNHQISPLFQLVRPLSPSSDNIFHHGLF